MPTSLSRSAAISAGAIATITPAASDYSNPGQELPDTALVAGPAMRRRARGRRCVMRHFAVRLMSVAFVLPLVVGFTPVNSTTRQLSDTRFLVSASWLAQLGDDSRVVVVDTRPADAYATAHIPSAVNVPWTRLAQPNTDEDAITPWQEQDCPAAGGRGHQP